MLDINLIREDPDKLRAALRRRQMNPGSVDDVLAMDLKRRSLLAQVEVLKAERNKTSREIGGQKDPEARQGKIEAMRLVGDKISAIDLEVKIVDQELQSILSGIPNYPDARVPQGKDDSDNVVVETTGDLPEFDYTPLPHWDLGPRLNIIDFDQGVKLTGSRFYVLSGAGARLQRALIFWMLDLHIRQGYLEKYPPFMVRGATLYASGQLPKFADNLYHDHEEDLWMVPTAEVPLTGLHMDDFIAEEHLPLRYTAYTPCFRREKISAGRDVRGIKRGYQFDKVEMYIFCREEESESELTKLVRDAEQTCSDLKLPYRKIQVCTGDLGFNSSITYDIEVWAAGCKEWLEVSSISNVTDFQARRANIKYCRAEGGRNRFVHTLNGSGLGLPRTLIAILENYQQKDGSVVVPDVLKPFMGGIEVIEPA